MSKFKLVRSIPLAAIAAGAILGSVATASADTGTDDTADIRDSESTSVPAPKIGYGTPIGGGMVPLIGKGTPIGGGM